MLLYRVYLCHFQEGLNNNGIDDVKSLGREGRLKFHQLCRKNSALRGAILSSSWRQVALWQPARWWKPQCSNYKSTLSASVVTCAQETFKVKAFKVEFVLR